MKPIHIVTTIVRLFAIWLFVYLLELATFALLLNDGDTNTLPLFLSFFIVTAILILAIYLWVYPESVSRRLTGDLKEEVGQQSFMKAEEFASICFFTLGLYLLYGVIGELVYWVKFLNDPLIQQVQPELSANQVATLWGLGARVLLVLFLLLGNNNLVKIVRWLRSAG